jgi:UDP-2-acetamido-3-amino-2,3-dideoxy-glucuronate N-acetyltransferase
MNDKRRANVCVVGCGHWGKNLARNFLQLNQLNAICETEPERFVELSANYPDARICGSFRDVLFNPEIEAVALATPAEQHYKIALAALHAGKHVFVENRWRSML